VTCGKLLSLLASCRLSPFCWRCPQLPLNMLMLLTATKTQNVTATALWGSGLVYLIDSIYLTLSLSLTLYLSLSFFSLPAVHSPVVLFLISATRGATYAILSPTTASTTDFPTTPVTPSLFPDFSGSESVELGACILSHILRS